MNRDRQRAAIWQIVLPLFLMIAIKVCTRGF